MKFFKYIKSIPDSFSRDADLYDAADLKNEITEATKRIDKAAADLEANADYQAAKEDVAACSSGLKSVKKNDGAKISYCLLRLKEDAGNLTEAEQEDLDAYRSKVKSRMPKEKAKELAQKLADGLPGNMSVSVNGGPSFKGSGE